MKVIECIDQLKDYVTLYNSIYNGSEKISNILLSYDFTDRDHIQYKHLEQAHIIILEMLKVFPHEAIDTNKFFRDINLGKLKILKERYEIILKELDRFYSDLEMVELINIFKRRKEKLDELFLKKDDPSINNINFIGALLALLYNTKEYVRTDEYQELYNYIFNEFLKMRNYMTDYIRNLDLPETPDWEMSMRKV